MLIFCDFYKQFIPFKEDFPQKRCCLFQNFHIGSEKGRGKNSGSEVHDKSRRVPASAIFKLYSRAMKFSY